MFLTMMKKTLKHLIMVFLLTFPLMSNAQSLAEPNSEGAAMGHLHFWTTEPERTQLFWETLGATPIQNGPISYYGIPGVVIIFFDENPSSGSVGTLIDHLGFDVADADALAASLQAAGFDIEIDSPGRFNVNAPNDMLIEVRENTEINATIELNHIHFYNPEYEAMQQWYADMFGSESSAGEYSYGYIPGVNLTFSDSEEARPAIQGTVLDHIGFEVVDLEATLTKLEAAGVPITLSYRVVPDTELAIAFLVDPWGTNIELTQGLIP